MIFLISLSAALLLTVLFADQLRKHPAPFYLCSLLIAVSVVVFTWHHTVFPDPFGTWVWPIFARGAFAGAFFVIIMCTGALPNGSEAIRILMPVRGQLSIIAGILTFGHNIAYGKTYFTALFQTPSNLPRPTLLAAVCSLVMILIMLPLWITSFPFVRKKMEARKWKQLQRFAYVFYALLYCHVMLLAVPNAIRGKAGYLLTVFVYSSVFISYLYCRILKAAAIKEKTAPSLPRKQIGGILSGLAMSGLILLAVISARKAAVLAEELETAQISIRNLNAANTQVQGVLTDQSEGESSADDPQATQPENSRKYKEGTFIGNAKGNHGTSKDVEVAVTLEDDRISAIEITGFRDDEEYYSPTVEGAVMIEEMLEKQSAYVDCITGATETSEALIRAVSAALSQARNQ